MPEVSRPFEKEAREYTKSLKSNSIRVMCRLAFMAGANLVAQRGAAWVQAYANRSDLPPFEARERFLASLSNPEFKTEE